MRWVEVAEVRVMTAVGVAQDAGRAAWEVPRLPGLVGTASAPSAGTGNRIWQGVPATSSSAPSAVPE